MSELCKYVLSTEKEMRVARSGQHQWVGVTKPLAFLIQSSCFDWTTAPNFKQPLSLSYPHRIDMIKYPWFWLSLIVCNASININISIYNHQHYGAFSRMSTVHPWWTLETGQCCQLHRPVGESPSALTGSQLLLLWGTAESRADGIMANIDQWLTFGRRFPFTVAVAVKQDRRLAWSSLKWRKSN